MGESLPGPDDRLDGWQEIAHYLRKSVRSAQRWETERGLPIRRLLGQEREGEVVFALKSEIEAWRAMRSARREDVESAEPVTQPGPQGVPSSRRVALLVHAGLTVALIATVLATGFWLSRTRGTAMSGPPDSVSVGPEKLSLPDLTTLDAGPWPADGHDPRQTQQTDAIGPGPNPQVRLFYDAGQLLGGGAAALAVRSNGDLLLGVQDEVRAVTADGTHRWTFPLVRQAHDVHEAPTGFLVARDGTVYISTHDVPDDDDSHTVSFYALHADGTLKWRNRKTPMPTAPAAGPHGSILQPTEYGTLTSYQPNGAVSWMAHLPGFSPRRPAVDSRGRIYFGSDGSTFKGHSLTAMNSDGSIIWTAMDSQVFSTAIGSFDEVHVVDASARVTKFTAAGERMSTVQLPGRPVNEPAALGRGSNVLFVQTTTTLAAVSGGHIVWSVPLTPSEEPRTGPLLDLNENVYVATGNDVCSFDRAGAKRWCVPVPSPGRIVPGGSGRLYVVSDARRIYAITSESR